MFNSYVLLTPEMLPLFDAGVPSPMWRGWLRKRERPSSLRSSFVREARGKPRLSGRWTCCLSWTTREFSISTTPLRRRTWWCSSQSRILSEQFHSQWNMVSSREPFYNLTQNCSNRSSLSRKKATPFLQCCFKFYLLRCWTEVHLKASQGH